MPITDRLAPIRSNKVPPKGAVAAGVTPNGDQLYKFTRKMARSVAKLDENGKPVFRRNPTTGEAIPGMPQVREPVIYEEEQLFFLDDDGHGNVHKIMWTPASEAELKAAQRRQQATALQSQLAELMVEEGISPKDLVAAIRGGKAVPTEDAPPELASGGNEDGDEGDAAGDEAPAPEVDFGEYPKYLKVGTWELCNGEQVGGPGDKAMKKDEAQELNAVAQVEMEAAAEARSNMDAVPEV